MTNPKVEIDIADLFQEIRRELKNIDNRLNTIEVGQETIKGEIKTIDEKLSGQIKTIDEKLSGQIKTIDVKVEQLNTRIGNVEFATRGVLIGIAVIVLGGVAMLFGIGKP